MKALGLAVALALLAGCAGGGPRSSAPIVPVGSVDPNANLNKLTERGLIPAMIPGSPVDPIKREIPSETVELVVAPDDKRAKAALAWLLTDEDNVLLKREARDDGTAVYTFLRRAGRKTPGDGLGDVKIFTPK